MLPQIMTVSGNYFSFEHPEESTYTIEDIGHALAAINRYTGHTRVPYSVAQHSVIGSYYIDPEHALAFLLHDSAEAFCGDVSSPLKALIRDVYKPIEERIEKAIMDKFGLPFPYHPAIKVMDNIMLQTEMMDLMPGNHRVLEGVEPLGDVIVPVSHSLAKRMFIDRFYELTEKK